MSHAIAPLQYQCLAVRFTLLNRAEIPLANSRSPSIRVALLVQLGRPCLE